MLAACLIIISYRFVLADEDADFAYIKSKAIELFFPNQGKYYFDKDINECELNDSTGNILQDRLILKNFLKESGLYLSKMYFILYTKCNNNGREGFFNNDDVDSLFSDAFEVMENLIRGSSVSSESQLPGATVDIVKAQSGYSSSTISRNANAPRRSINTPVLSAPETPAFFETLMSQRVVRYETSPVFINYEEQDLRNFRNSDSDVRFQHHNSGLDQTGVTITQDVVSLREDSPQILDTQITVIQQSCETIDATSNETRGDLETDLEVNARHDDNVISQQVNSFDSHDADTLPYVSESDKKILRIHRLNLRQDMINTFKNVNQLDHIQFEARGRKDDGRGLGAERDLYASF